MKQLLIVFILSVVTFAAQATQPTSYYVYDESGHVIGEYDQNGNPIQEHIYLGDRPVAVAVTSTVNDTPITTVDYVTTDQLNTPRDITDGSGAVIWSWNSDPFGNGQPTSTSFTYNLRFPGQYYDVETGHDYNYHRDYDPSTDRYMESDPSGLKGGLNTYVYAGSNPFSHSDFLGLDYWVEGAQPGEGGLGFHQKICVGHPGNSRLCISFGVAESGCYFNCKGEVYDNTNPPAPYPITDMYTYTSQSVDNEISVWFQSLIGTKGTYSLLGNNCRNFSQNMFKTLNAAFGGSM
jgi:RHS repeat-associated protein